VSRKGTKRRVTSGIYWNSGLPAYFTICQFLQYVSFELRYDAFHEKAGQIYRIPVETYLANRQREYIDASGPPAMGPALAQNFPEVAEMVRLHWIYDGAVLSYKNVRFREEKIYYAEPSFFAIFSFPLAKGESRTALNEPNSVVLTKSTARKYFGNGEAIGKVIQFGGNKNLLVTGVLKDVPANSHLQFSALISFATLAQTEKEGLNNWTWYNFFTYQLLKPNADPAAFAVKLPAFIEKYQGENM